MTFSSQSVNLPQQVLSPQSKQTVWIKHSQLCNLQWYQKSTPYGPIEVVDAVEATEAETVVNAEEAETRVKEVKQLQTRNIKVPSTQIFQLVTGQGAVCISDGAGVHFSAVSLEPALGRTSLHPRTSETGANLVI